MAIASSGDSRDGIRAGPNLSSPTRGTLAT
jgi:hypothetical protein